MRPYYEHGGIVIYHGRAEDVLPTLEAGSVDLVLTDPPYFRVKDEWWDRQWDSPESFLAWLGAMCTEWKRLLKPNGSLYVFASPDMAGRVEVLVRQHFNVLNRIRWLKEAGWHKKADPAELRSYLSPWEEIIFAEQYGDAYMDAAQALHKNVFAPIGRYIQAERERAGLTRSEVEVALGYVSSVDPTRGTALCYRWEEGACLPTPETYERLRAVLNDRAKPNGEYLRQEYEDLRQEYEDLRQEYEDLRRPFAVEGTGIHTDVWQFATVPPVPGKHTCEKPLAMMEHIIRTSTRDGALVLDCFMGRGTTLRAAKHLSRRAIGVEQSMRWCKASVNRLAQEVLL